MRMMSVQREPEEFITHIIDADARIYANKLGIPHIRTTSDGAMFFAMGYEHSRQRLWQMIQMRRVAEGRLSELYGRDFLNVDLFMRAINIPSIADDIYKKSDAATKSVLQSYTDGINFYIEHNQGRLTFEFAADNYVPEKWQPRDCYIIQRYFAFLMSNNLHNDMLLSQIANVLGKDRALELVPQYPQNAPFILDKLGHEYSDTVVPIMLSTDSLQSIPPTPQPISHITTSGHIGSNTWAVHKANDNTTILAADVHLPFTIPCLYMEMHIFGPSYNVVGASIPGMPMFLFGKNSNIAWGCANMMVDDIDLLIQRFDKSKDRYYIDEKTTKPVAEIVDSIKIKDAAPHKYYKRSIDGKTIFSDMQFDAYAIANNENAIFLSGKPKPSKIKAVNEFTLNWTGYNVSDEIGAMLKVMRASDWNEFVADLGSWQVPGLVFSYADNGGNVGIAPRALIPIREDNWTPLLAMPYWQTTNGGWRSYIKPTHIKTSYNPQKRYVFAANNGIERNDNEYFGAYYALSSRGHRIDEMLQREDAYTYRDAQYMQNDQVSYFADVFLKRIKPIFDKHLNSLSQQELRALFAMNEWDYLMSRALSQPTIFNMFISHLVKNIFMDELGDYYHYYIMNANTALLKLNELLDEPTSIWFNNISTDKYETAEDVIIQSFKDAVSSLSKIYNNEDVSQWRYGDKHYVEFSHFYRMRNYLQNTGYIGKYSVGGSFGTINYMEWKFNSAFAVVAGATMRFIADMQQDEVYMVLSGGNSGDPVSPNYSDQVQLWQIGAYIKLRGDELPADDFNLLVTFHNE
jgi:penicillin amidase